nr:hypothetical protein [Tanacetum cinerariifolium]
MLALIHIARSLRKIFRTYKVSMVTDGPTKDMLKVSRTTRRLATLVEELRTYHVSYIKRKETEGKIMKKIGQGEQVLQVPGRESNKEGFDVKMILVDPEGKRYSYAVRLSFYASEDDMDYEALLAGLVASSG